MRFSGAVGYADTDREIAPGVWQEVMVEKTYFGDVIRDSTRLVSPALTLNDDISVANSFAVVADGYASENFEKIRYVKWNGNAWEVINVEVRRPRLILTIGGLWNGPTA